MWLVDSDDYIYVVRIGLHDMVAFQQRPEWARAFLTENSKYKSPEARVCGIVKNSKEISEDGRKEKTRDVTIESLTQL
jgi:hypothetical protein